MNKNREAIKVMGYEPCRVEYQSIIYDERDNDDPARKDNTSLQKHIDSAYTYIGVNQPYENFIENLVSESPSLEPLSRSTKAKAFLRDFIAVQASRRIHQGSTLSRYKNLYEGLDSLWKRTILKCTDGLFSGLNLHARLECLNTISNLAPAGASILEVGCGFGGNLVLLNRLRPDLQLSGFEYTNSRLASSFVNLSNSSTPAEIYLSNALSFDTSRKHDIVFSFHVLEQLSNKYGIFALMRMLKAAKIAVVCVEPDITVANLYQRYRIKTLNYCHTIKKVEPTTNNLHLHYHKKSSMYIWPAISSISVFTSAKPT